MLTIFPPPQPPTWTKHILLSATSFISAAKATIPRGFRKRYIPLWDDECSTHYQDFLHTQPGDEDAANKASALTDCLDKKRRERWEETVQGIDFSHSSRRAWRTFNRLTGRSAKPTRCPVSANAIAKQLLENGKFKDASKEHALHVKQETSALWRAPGVDGFLSTPFTHPGTYASRPPTQEWKGPGTRQHPSRVSYPLRPKMS